jgi:hypothetical protein
MVENMLLRSPACPNMRRPPYSNIIANDAS